MNEGQKLTLELLIILALMVIFSREQTLTFWKTLFTKQPFEISQPVIPPLVNISPPSVSLPNPIPSVKGSG